jgi:hypothetical protein
MPQLNLDRKSVHFWVYYLSLCLLLLSLPSSRFLITLSLIFLLVNWIAEGNFKFRFNAFFNNKPALAFTLIYVLNFVGIFWSENIPYAFNNDLLHKLPMLFMPLVISTSPVPDSRKIRLLLMLFISSVFLVSIAGVAIMFFKQNLDFREASPFIPNIYFCIMLLMAAFQLPILAKQYSNRKYWFYLSLAVSVWFIFFIFYLRSLSGIAALAGVSFFSIIYLVYKHKSKILKLVSAFVFLVFMGYLSWMLVSMYKRAHSETYTNLSTLPKLSELGNYYHHDTINLLRENGNLVYLYIADCELEEAWKIRSNYNFYGADQFGHELRYTLYRYMASKGLTKDKQGINSLTDIDIAAIEKGTTNYLYNNWSGLHIRLHQMMMGVYIYRKSSYQDPTWSTLTERIDLWRASLHAFKKYPLFGWGTGSILNAMNYGLELNGSKLIGKNMKPHNQYIYTLLILGVFGLATFLWLYIYIIIKTKVYKIYIFNVFALIFAIHFLANNSIESQIGQNVFVFFSLFYFFIYPKLTAN